MKFIGKWFLLVLKKSVMPVMPEMSKIHGAKIRPELLDPKFIEARKKWCADHKKKLESFITKIPEREIPNYFRYHKLRLDAEQFYKDLAKKHEREEELKKEISPQIEEKDLAGDQSFEDHGN